MPPEREAVQAILGDGFAIIVSGLRRETSGAMTGDAWLQEHQLVLFQDRATINTPDGRQAWANAAAVQAPDGPTPARLVEALLQQVVPAAEAALQAGSKRPSQVDQLVGMVTDVLVTDPRSKAHELAGAIELFHDPGDIAYATIEVDGHLETHPVRSRAFRGWLTRKFFHEYGKVPGGQTLTDAIGLLEGIARFDGSQREVYLRIAEHEGVIYLDLGNERWEVVAISASGWQIKATPLVKFRRTRGMLPLPAPTRGGSLADLRHFLNVPGDEDEQDQGITWRLVLAWLVGAFNSCGPYPVLVVLGEQGSAKSTLQRILRALIDPNKAMLRSLPKEERDLAIAANNAWVLGFDNISSLSPWMSDALCRVSTGGGFATRELYSDLDETICEAQRPIMLNGIEEAATRSDLLDRSLIARLPSIRTTGRRPERALWAAFERARPALLGALLDAIVVACANHAAVKLAEHPRMADFATWVVAAESALPWSAGDFITAYLGNQDDANALVLDSSLVAAAVIQLQQHQPTGWSGTATELLTALNGITNELVQKQQAWPKDGRALRNKLDRVAPNLRASGIEMVCSRQGKQRTRIITLARSGNHPSAASAALPDTAKLALGRPRAGFDEADVSSQADGNGPLADADETGAWVQNFSLEQGNEPMADATDAEIPTCAPRRECVQCAAPLPADVLGLCCRKHGAQDGIRYEEQPTKIAVDRAGADDDGWEVA